MGHRGEKETSFGGERNNHFCGYQNLHQQQVTTNPASKIAERETKAVMLGANPGHTLLIDLDMCNIEFPHFGASYPDAHCINGYLYDMDSYENGRYTIGGNDPCPFCNTEEWLKDVLDDEIFKTREEALEWVDKMREKYGKNH